MKLLWRVQIIWAVCLCLCSSVLSQRNNRQSGIATCKSPETCISIRRCPPLLDLLREQGRNPQVAASLRQKHCGTENGTPKVCCPQSSSSFSGGPSPSISDQQNRNPTSSSSGDFSECGRSEKKDTRIVGGKNATLGDWPWMVGLSYRSPTNPGPDFRCGATLISRQWVVSAAHCVRNIGNYEVDFARIGDLDLDDSVNDGASPVDAQIDRIVPHPEYSTNPMLNDIALIHLKNPVQFTANIRPICLLSGAEYRANEYYNRKQPFIIGWGAVGWREKSSSRLQEASIKVIEQSKCAQQYISQRTALINEKIICAGEPGKDTCQGDSGGPLIFPNNTEVRFYLGGIVSYGIRCATNYPGVYTRVSQFIGWINQVTGEKF